MNILETELELIFIGIAEVHIHNLQSVCFLGQLESRLEARCLTGQNRSRYHTRQNFFGITNGVRLSVLT